MTNAWPHQQLGQLLSIQNGYAFDSKSFSSSEGVPLIRIRDLKNGFVTETRYVGDFDPRYLVEAGDLLVGMDGEFGCYQWRGEQALLNQRVCKLRNFSGNLWPRFLLYGLNGFLKAIEEVTAFTTVKHISSKQIASIKFPVPPIYQQRRAADILDRATEMIEAAVANTEKSLANVRELFESALDNILDFYGEELITRRLATLCDDRRIITYGVIKLGEDAPEGVPCLRTSNVRWLNIETAGMKRITPALSAEYRRTILNGTEILVNVRGTLGGVAAVRPEMAGWNVSREVAVVPLDCDKVDQHYLAYWIAKRSSQSWLTNVQKGVAYTGINIADLRELPVAVPARETQKCLVGRLDNLSDASRRLKAIYQQKLFNLAALKVAVLNKVFSGEEIAAMEEPLRKAAE